MFTVNPPKMPARRLVSSRKAQADGGSAAVLVAVIALLIIFYLLFIPPSFRDQILEGNGSSTTTSTTGTTTVNETIMKASPGTLSKISSNDIEHNIPSVMLYSKKESKKLDSLHSLAVKSSVFGSEDATMKVTIDDLTNTDKILLTFLSKKRKGALTIKVNGNTIFNAELSSENPAPVSINKKYLVKGSNTIYFASEKVGWKFWRVNRHNLETIQLTGDVKDISLQKSRNIFVVSSTEKANVKRAVLRFTPQCQTGTTGKLNVLINQHSVYYSPPDCGGRVAIEFTTDVLRTGENTIVFDSDKGNYIIDLIRMTSELKDILQPSYYFEVSDSTISDIKAGKYNLVLKLTFLEGKEQKSGTLNINGRETGIFQRSRTYSKNLNDYVVSGSNAIKITPKTKLEIASMEVVKG